MRINIVTSNPGKVAEYQRSFEELGIEAVHMRVPYDEIQSSDIEEVVRKGIAELRSQGVSDFIIDDTGLFIDSLKGFPGVWSAYVQRTIGNEGILKLMAGISKRDAAFRCCIGCCIGSRDIIVTGVCTGVILGEERGDGGFGYDPIFSHDGCRSFAEISLDEKNSVSHRGNAVRLLIGEIKDIL